ncbi:hypothetical protein DID75_05515 [Candidatus Marinamargulisbacteria bacterium SCGC AG-410-N11]|nr:hypothetical protein DID75_05515 [Candidatus Marinamargulisbacteria bacterium SCGC AG-410-N11]
MRIKNTILLLVILIVLHPINVISASYEESLPDVNLLTSSNTLELTETQESYLSQLSQIEDFVKNNQFSDALNLLINLSNTIKNKRLFSLNTYFPNYFLDYKYIEKDDSELFNDSNYGVLFSKHYRNKRGNVLDVYVIYSDPSIKEYFRLLRNPELIEGVTNLNVVKINKQYYALEKKSDGESIYECNMLVNNKLLVNLVSDSKKEIELFNTFISKSRIDKLEKYLKINSL